MLVYRYFRKALSVALFAFVLFAALLFEDNDLVRSAVLYDRCFDGSGTDCTFGEKRVDVDLLSCLSTDSRHAKRHTALDRKLLSACFNNCVTHYSVSSSDLTVQFCAQVEKLKLYGNGVHTSNQLPTKYTKGTKIKIGPFFVSFVYFVGGAFLGYRWIFDHRDKW